MKKITTLTYLIALIAVCISCDNDIDNYDAPSGGIRGTVFDAQTNEPIPLPVAGSSGVMVNLYELNTNATKSVDFRAKQDGTYENSRVFNGEYRVVVNGPFTDKCEGNITIKGQTKLDLTATPFARVDIQAAVNDNNQLAVTYTAIASSSSYTINEVSIMWNFAPGVDANSSNYASRSTKADASGTYTFDLPNDNAFKDNLHKIKANQNRIYVRVAAHTGGGVNYSKIVELTVK